MREINTYDNNSVNKCPVKTITIILPNFSMLAKGIGLKFLQTSLSVLSLEKVDNY